MNNSKLVVSSSPTFKADGQIEPAATRASLFVAWRSAEEVGAPEDEIAIPVTAEQAASNCGHVLKEPRDHGLWLLRKAAILREDWSRLDRQPLAKELHAPLQELRWYAAMKRICDIGISGALLLLLAPLFALVAALVRIDSRGPSFFRQRRVGLDGREFRMWKFRSMRVEVPKYKTSPTTDVDWRVTRAGRVIRRISVDELPQLINVLRGEMSLVGPRPEMPFIVAGYSDLERKRLEVKPGITGLWQVSPARAFPIHKHLQYDLHYIRHQNLILDVAILLRTIVSVIRGVGAV